MPEQAVAIESKPLSQTERVIDTFVAPSKTFTDIRRNASWWLPCVLILLLSAVSSVTMFKKVGIARMSENILATMPKMQDMIANAKPDDAQVIRSKFESNIQNQLYLGPVIVVAASFLIALLFLMTANFGFGGRATYKGMLAMYWYSILPLILISVLISVLLAFGVNVETFRVANPVGTNPGYYMPDGSSPVLVAALSFLDVFSVWIVCLQTIGTSIVARISLGKAFAAVALWWVLYLVVKLLPALLFS